MAYLTLSQIGDSDPTFFHQWWLVATWVLVLGIGLATLYARLRPQRRDVKMMDAFVTTEQCSRTLAPIHARVSRVEAEIVDLRREMKQDRQDLDEASEARISELHKRIDRLKDDIQQIPAQVVTQLLNTRQLWKPDHER